LRAFENWELRKNFGARMDEVRGFGEKIAY
jgi:hypothetical protein